MKKKIALVTGGFTGESVVSLKSAAFVENKIRDLQYDIYKIILTPESWFHESDSVRSEVDKNDFSIRKGSEKIIFDAAFIILHGSPGEDGKLQGYFDMIGIPYTSCDALTSSLTMNKGYTKSVVNGIPDLNTARSVQLYLKQSDYKQLVTLNLDLPYFVKPNNGGSSIGMSKVKALADLDEALDIAFKEDEQVLVEEFIDGREFSVGVYRNREGVQVLPATEVISPKEFFDFEAKYTPGLSEEITPGRMSAEERSRVERIATDIYTRLNCRGMVRIDYFLQKETGKFFFVEINTIPGQTETSFIPQQVKAAGMDVSAFYGDLIEGALAGW